MTSAVLERRLRGARAGLAAATIARAILWCLAAALLVLVALAALDALVGLSLATRRRAGALVALAALLAAAFTLARGRLVPSRASAALWIEERLPRLHYALVTAVERPELAPRLAARVVHERWEPLVRRAALRALVPPAALAGLLAIGLLLLPTGARARVLSPREGDATERPLVGDRPVDRLATIAVTVSPPAYSGLGAESLDDPSAVRALVGSRIAVRGRGASGGLGAVLGETTLPVGADGDRWSARLVMPVRPAVLRLRDGARERLLLLDPRTDSAPAPLLELPARDTILREGAGTVALRATVRDDFGLASASFEYIVSSGAGESFTFRSGTLGARALLERSASLSASLPLESLALKPGDVVHLSAVARDRNDVTGPGIGRSDTRVIRVARAGEYDSVSIEAAPPPEADKSILSQRMLLQLTEELQRRRRRLSRDSVVRESRRIAEDQRKLRRAVGDIVYSRSGAGDGAEHSHESDEEHAAHEGGPLTAEERMLRAAEAATRHSAEETLDFAEGESPVLAINRPLLEAYNHMWDAARELEIGEPGAAIPPMRRALAAIQRARQAERIYLRGRPPDVVVDIARARLQGKGPERALAERLARAPLDAATRRRSARLTRAIARLTSDPRAATDSLLLLRLDALGDAPALADALGQAADALRAGRDATDALVRARRLVAGAPAAEPLGAWEAMP